MAAPDPNRPGSHLGKMMIYGIVGVLALFVTTSQGWQGRWYDWALVSLAGICVGLSLYYNLQYRDAQRRAADALSREHGRGRRE